MYTEQAFCAVTAKINFTLTNPVSRLLYSPDNFLEYYVAATCDNMQ